MAASGIDLLAFSGHKLYAPFGAGALVAAALPADGEPLLHGGGAIELVTLDDVIWADAPERYEAGSPNVRREPWRSPRHAAPCSEVGMDAVADHERATRDAAVDGRGCARRLRTLTAVARRSRPRRRSDLQPRRLSPPTAGRGAERRTRDRRSPRLLLRAHPLITRLLGIADDELERLAAELRAGRRPPSPGPSRASLGLGTTPTTSID